MLEIMTKSCFMLISNKLRGLIYNLPQDTEEKL